MDSHNPKRDDALPESRFGVILVEPQYPDNVGHVARSLLNFGVGELTLVRPAVALDDRVRNRAVHAQRVLDEAPIVASMTEVRAKYDTLVAFAARVSTLDKAHLRMADTLPEVARRLEGVKGRVGLVFGREDSGLANDDVEMCDILCAIPTWPHYKSMNLSHAVTVALYEMQRASHPDKAEMTMATSHEKDLLFAHWYHLCKDLGYPNYRADQSLRMLRRLVGRATLTAWEYHRFMGVLSRSLKRLGAWPPPGIDALPPDIDDDEGDGKDRAERGASS